MKEEKRIKLSLTEDTTNELFIALHKHKEKLEEKLTKDITPGERLEITERIKDTEIGCVDIKGQVLLRNIDFNHIR